jgi:transposase
MGLKPLLMSAQLVKPYRSEGATGKNDANDAAAIFEAASRPTMRFVPVKSVERQSMLCVHRLREGPKADRTGCIGAGCQVGSHDGAQGSTDNHRAHHPMKPKSA